MKLDIFMKDETRYVSGIIESLIENKNDMLWKNIAALVSFCAIN